MTERDLLAVAVPRAQLADVLRGERPQNASTFHAGLQPRLLAKETLVFWTRDSRRPCIVVVGDDDREELFNWTVSFHRDLSPLTSWCNVLTSKEALRLTQAGRWEGNLQGLEAAWAGAAIAEAMVLSRRSYEAISLPACLATNTFAVGRTVSLYGVRSAFADTIERLEQIRDRFRRSPERARINPSTMLGVLLRLLPDAPPTANANQELFVRACNALRATGTDKDRTIPIDVLQDLREIVPQLRLLESLDDAPAEQRVRFLREFPNWIKLAKHEEQRQVFYFAAGYIISRIGGAERDLRLAESFEGGYANVVTWAAVLGGLGATTYWSDAFGGIGRLVARELARSVDLTDAPTSDISADELLVVAGRDSGPAKFRTAMRHVATIAVKPGVVVQLSTSDDVGGSRVDENEKPSARAAPPNPDIVLDSRQLQTLAEQLFPFLRNLLVRAGFDPNNLGDRRSTRKSRAPQLPLK
jgi:hypothetical protein